MNNLLTKGFTLTELIIVLLITSIILVIAVPSYRQTTRENRLTAYINSLVGALQLARSEAIKRGTTVMVQRGSDPDQDGTFVGDWDDGWEVFVDWNGNSIKDTAVPVPDPIVRVGNALPANFTLRGNTPVANRISYLSNGRSNAAGSFVLCEDGDGNQIPESMTARMITINTAGRVRIAAKSTNQIPLDSNNQEIKSCIAPFDTAPP